MRSDSPIMKKIQGVMILQLDYGLTAAMSWIYFVVVLVFVGITSALISRGVYYYD